MRSRVRVERETCETAGDMESNLAAPPVESGRRASFPPSNWGPSGALLGAVLAIVVGLVLGLPAIAFTDAAGDLTTAGNVIAQLGLVIGLLVVPLAIACSHGAHDAAASACAGSGCSGFQPSALKWMAAAVGAYLAFAIAYSALIVEPEQEDIAESFGPVPVQVLLIVVAAAIAEEICFRGMLFGGLRERLPKLGGGADRRHRLRPPARLHRAQRGAAADRLRLHLLPALREDRLDRAGDAAARAEQLCRPPRSVGFRA